MQSLLTTHDFDRVRDEDVTFYKVATIE
jgi:hypothetical protein